MVRSKPRSPPQRIFLLVALLACEPVHAGQLSVPGSAGKSSASEAGDKRLVLRLVAGRDWAPQGMEIVKGLVIFEALVNNRPATILLDNGTGRTVVDTRFAQRAGIPISQTAAKALTGSAEIATFRTGRTVLDVPNAFTLTSELASFDLRQMSQALGRQIDAVLGSDAVNLMAVMLQPDKKQVAFLPSGSIKLDGPDVARLPLLPGNVVEATINGHKVRLLVDFGYSGAVRLSDAAWKQVAGGSEKGTAVQNGITADGTALRSRVATGALRIGSISSQTAPIASGYVPVGASDGLLGSGFFLQGTSVVDGPARQVMLIVRQTNQGPPARPE